GPSSTSAKSVAAERCSLPHSQAGAVTSRVVSIPPRSVPGVPHAQTIQGLPVARSWFEAACVVSRRTGGLGAGGARGNFPAECQIRHLFQRREATGALWDRGPSQGGHARSLGGPGRA